MAQITTYLKLNNVDFSSYIQHMKIEYETLVADNSGRNANGDTVLDIRNRKVKVYCSFRPLNKTEASALLTAIANYVIPVQYYDAKTNALKTITCYCGTPALDIYWFNEGGDVLYKAFDLNFIEM